MALDLDARISNADCPNYGRQQEERDLASEPVLEGPRCSTDTPASTSNATSMPGSAVAPPRADATQNIAQSDLIPSQMQPGTGQPKSRSLLSLAKQAMQSMSTSQGDAPTTTAHGRVSGLQVPMQSCQIQSHSCGSARAPPGQGSARTASPLRGPAFALARGPPLGLQQPSFPQPGVQHPVLQQASPSQIAVPSAGCSPLQAPLTLRRQPHGASTNAALPIQQSGALPQAPSQRPGSPARLQQASQMGVGGWPLPSAANMPGPTAPLPAGAPSSCAPTDLPSSGVMSTTSLTSSSVAGSLAGILRERPTPLGSPDGSQSTRCMLSPVSTVRTCSPGPRRYPWKPGAADIGVREAQQPQRLDTPQRGLLIDALFNAVDADRDGMISLSDFRSALCGSQQGGTPRGKAAPLDGTPTAGQRGPPVHPVTPPAKQDLSSVLGTATVAEAFR